MGYISVDVVVPGRTYTVVLGFDTHYTGTNCAGVHIRCSSDNANDRGDVLGHGVDANGAVLNVDQLCDVRHSGGDSTFFISSSYFRVQCDFTNDEWAKYTYTFTKTDQAVYEFFQSTEPLPLGGMGVCIKPVYCNKNLDVFACSKDNCAKLQLWTAHGGLNQRFNFVKDAHDGTYKIVNVNSGKVLDVEGENYSNGARIIQYDSTGKDNQRFRLVSGGAVNTYVILVKNRPMYALDMKAQATADGTPLQLYEAIIGVNDDAQRFVIYAPT